MNKQKNTILDVPLLQASILVLLLFKLCAILGRSYLQLELQDSGYSPLFAKDLSWLLVPVILGILMLPILRQNSRQLIDLVSIRSVTCRLVLASIVLGIALRIAYWGGRVAYVSFVSTRGPDAGAADSLLFDFYCPAATTMGLTILVTVILTPLLEEIMNRGFIFHALMRRGPWVAIIGSAFLFGAFHEPPMTLPAMIVGLLLGMQYLQTQSLWAPCVTHATFNLLIIGDAVCLHTFWNPSIESTNINMVGSIALAIMIVFLIFAGKMTNRFWYIKWPGRDAPGPTRSIE